MNSQLLNPCRQRYKVGTISGGLGNASYDVCLAQDLWLWPGRFVLASTQEQFTMNNSVAAMVCDKSTWIRRGLSVFNTFIDPGWRGYLTLELKMNSFRFMHIPAGTPIAQIVFFFMDKGVDAYEGKYQDQVAGPVEAK